MKGAIIGDIAGMAWEHDPVKDLDDLYIENFTDFTDDTVLTVATADVLLNGKDYSETYVEYAEKYPNRGWGGTFKSWYKLPKEERLPYNSYGNGSAMRVSPIGWFFDSLEETLEEAKRSAEVTHNHPEGIKGAQSVAAAIYMARTGEGRNTIKKYIEDGFDYDLSRKYEDVWEDYSFDVTCQGSVPEAIICYLESNSYKDAVLRAINLGGDADTQGCITGSIAEAEYRVKDELWEEFEVLLPEEFREVVRGFMIETNKYLV